MRKAVLMLLTSTLLFACGVHAFPLDMTIDSWTKWTIPPNKHVNIAQISTPYDGCSVDTVSYPGAFEFNYDFFGYYNEIFIVPPSGRIQVEGYFMYDDITPHLDRKYLSLYLLRPDLSGYIANVTRILDYAYGHQPGTWYYCCPVIDNLEAGEEFLIAFGRGDLCDMDRELQACWAAVNVTSCRRLKVPNQYSTIQQAISEASPGDIIEVSSGTYYERLVVDKDDLEITGESSGTTFIDANIENGSDHAVYITGRKVFFSGFTVQNCPDGSGIEIYGENVTIIECDIMNNTVAIGLFADNSRIVKNNIHNNVQGIWIQSSVEDCTFYHNSFLNNTRNICHQQPLEGVNVWDNGYAGNFWSNYTGIDMNGDGIGDTSHIIDSNNIDNYPLMSPYMPGDINYDGKIDMRDVGFVARRFGCTPTDPLWNPHADINEDRKIDMRDVSITARKFGYE